MSLAARVEESAMSDVPKTSEEFQARVRDIQERYQAEVFQLQASGKFSEMQSLTLNFQLAMQKLISDFQAYQSEQAQAQILKAVPTPELEGPKTPEEFQARVGACQAQYQAQILELQALGNFTAIQALTLTFQAELQKMVADFQAYQSEKYSKGEPVSEAKPQAEVSQSTQDYLSEKPGAKEIVDQYDNSVCTLDLGGTVYEGDRRSLRALLSDSVFMAASEELLKDNPVQQARKMLMKNCLHLTPKMAPKLYAIGERCKEILGLKINLDFYVYEDFSANAACYPPLDGKYFILISSALLEKFDDEEMAFVLGHEIGHAMFDHHCLPTGIILERGRGHISPVHAMKLFAWKRNKEVTADRVGLICCQNFEAVARAFFKLSSGIRADTLNFQLHEYLDQFTDLKNELNVSDPEDWYSTHPFSPLRLKALEIFTRSSVYGKITGQASGTIPKDDMESEIREFMSLMDPSYLDDDTQVASLMREFVFLGGYLISAANGTIEESEIQSLSGLLSKEAFAEGMKAIQSLSVEQLKIRMSELAEKLNMHLPALARLNLIKDLSVIVYADGSVEDSEMRILYHICTLLGIHEDFADQVIADAGDVDE